MKKKMVNKIRKIIRSILSVSIQKRLGYPQDTKLLIIHADDLGLCESENKATFEAFKKGMVNSGSVMVNCPAFDEVAKYSNENPNADIGIHLTVTSEWESYKCKPILNCYEVPDIIDDNGYFFENNTHLHKSEALDDIKKEYAAQISKALQAGMNITHLDSHMFTAFSSLEVLKLYKALGREFRLPVLLTQELPLSTLFEKNAIIVDHLIYAKPKDCIKEPQNYYSEALRSLKPGLSCILIHAAFDDEQMRQITGGRPDYGAAWRQADYDFFTSEQCRKLITDNKIQLITWREIRDKLIR